MMFPNFRTSRRLIVYVHDIFMAAVSFVLALLLRMGDTMREISIFFNRYVSVVGLRSRSSAAPPGP